MNQREFTAIYKKRGDKYIAWIEEVPGVNTQGRTKKETQENLAEALKLIIESNRTLLAKQRLGAVIREPFFVGLHSSA
jgi:predicted RNase H-like HicB family nuclease